MIMFRLILNILKTYSFDLGTRPWLCDDKTSADVAGTALPASCFTDKPTPHDIAPAASFPVSAEINSLFISAAP